MFSIDDLVTVLRGCVMRKELVDVCLSCDWCDAAHTIIPTDVFINTKGELCLEDAKGADIRIKNSADSIITADPIAREYHLMQSVGPDWMFILV